jgi:hypothetical protein
MRSDRRREATAWRLGGSAVALPVFTVVVLGQVTASAIGRVVDADRSTGALVRAILYAGLLLAVVVLTVIILARTRVALLPDGVEVRQFKRRLYRYDDITDVRVDRATGDRTIRLTLRDGTSVTLLAPTRGLRPPSDRTLDHAVQAIRDRAVLGPAPPRLP